MRGAAWLYARDLSWLDLFYMLRHDGHPILWFAALKLVQATGANYPGMMVLNWAFCAWGIWLLFYRSALPLAARFGVAFAPICLLEVAFTARNYAIAMPLCFLAAHFYRTAPKGLYAMSSLSRCWPAPMFLRRPFLWESPSSFCGSKLSPLARSPFSLRPLYTRYLGANLILLAGALLLVVQLAPVHLPGDPFPRSFINRPHIYTLFRQDIAIVFLAPLALVLFNRLPKNPRVLGGLPIALLAAVPTALYACLGRHLFMINLGLIYFCWIYLDSFLRAETQWGLKVGSIGVRLLITVLIGTAVFTSGRGGFAKFEHPPYDSSNAAQAVIRNGLDQPDTLLVTTEPFRTMSLLLVFKHIHGDYAPSQFGASPQSFAGVAYGSYFFEPTPSLEEMKPLILDLAQKNPTKTIVVVSTGTKPAADPPGDDSALHLVCLYQTPAASHFGPSDESYRVYVLKSAAQVP